MREGGRESLSLGGRGDKASARLGDGRERDKWRPRGYSPPIRSDSTPSSRDPYDDSLPVPPPVVVAAPSGARRPSRSATSDARRFHDPRRTLGGRPSSSAYMSFSFRIAVSAVLSVVCPHDGAGESERVPLGGLKYVRTGGRGWI